MSEQALEAVKANEPSQPTVEVKQEVEQGESPKVDSKAEEAPKVEEPKPLTEAEKVKLVMEKRLARKTAATKALEEKVKTLEQQIRTLPKQAVDDEPKIGEFETYDAYEKAVVEYKANKLVDERLKEAKSKELQELQARKQQEQRRDFETKESKFRDATPDYDDVVTRASEAIKDLEKRGANVGTLTSMILEFENAPEILYHVGKDENVLDDLVQLPPLGMMRELVKMELALQPAVKAETKPPEPIKSVSGRGGSKPLGQRSGKDILDWVRS